MLLIRRWFIFDGCNIYSIFVDVIFIVVQAAQIVELVSRKTLMALWCWRCLVVLCGNAYLGTFSRYFFCLFLPFPAIAKMLLNNVNMYVSKGNLMQKS